MSPEITILALSAASVAFFHTLFGPDHYLPFIVLAKARKWNMVKTMVITIICGLGHVGSSIVLGIIGVAMGIGISKIEGFESFRGNLAGWAIILFGLVYLIWAIRKKIKGKTHTHSHHHSDGTTHEHEHSHSEEHVHGHSKKTTIWILFIVFVLGPCEPLIPLFIYPAAQNSMSGVILVVSIFTLVTLATMLSMVLLAIYGFSFLPLKRLESYTHIIAGATILLSGVSMQFLGL